MLRTLHEWEYCVWALIVYKKNTNQYDTQIVYHIYTDERYGKWHGMVWYKFQINKEEKNFV